MSGGSGSMAACQSRGIPDRPVAQAMMPPTIAPLVSLSPGSEVAAQIASSYESSWRAAIQRQNGTVSRGLTSRPVPR